MALIFRNCLPPSALLSYFVFFVFLASISGFVVLKEVYFIFMFYLVLHDFLRRNIYRVSWMAHEYDKYVLSFRDKIMYVQNITTFYLDSQT